MDSVVCLAISAVIISPGRIGELPGNLSCLIGISLSRGFTSMVNPGQKTSSSYPVLSAINLPIILFGGSGM